MASHNHPTICFRATLLFLLLLLSGPPAVFAGNGCEPGTNEFRKTVTANELENLIEHEKLNTIVNTRITESWRAVSLTRINQPFVLFDSCYFEGGIEFLDLVCGTQLIFYNCTFNRCPVHGGGQCLIQESTFSQPITFKNCTFLMGFCICKTTFDNSFSAENLNCRQDAIIEQCAFLSVCKVNHSQFWQNVEMQADANGPVLFTDCEFNDTLHFQKGNFAAGLDLSGSRFNPTNGGLALNFDRLRVSSSLQFENTSLSTDENASFSFQSCSLENIRGLDWAAFRRGFRARTEADWVTTLSQMRLSYEKQGMFEDGDHAFLAYKAARSRNIVEKIIHWFMVISSGWGRYPSLLIMWFFLITGLFSVLYFRKLGFHDAPSNKLQCFLRCGIMSLRMTILQDHQVELEQLIKASGRFQSNARDPILALREHVLVHQFLAFVFLAMFSGYVGSLLAT